MPEPRETSPEIHSAARTDRTSLTERLTDHPGVARLVAEAESTWQARAEAEGIATARPGWRTFEDAFPTFYEFTNRPK